MSSNTDAINKFRQQIRDMIGDISEVDKKVLNKAVNVGLAHAKNNTPVVTGHLRKSWAANPVEELPNGVQKELINTADYALYWNDGHRVVAQTGWTVGWCEGSHLLDKTINVIEKAEEEEFEKEIRRISDKYD